MAPKKVFVTGVTGYIGGDGFFTLKQAHPDWEFSALVRNEEKGNVVSSVYPDVKLIYGSLDDANVIEKAASEADIILHTADSSDHEVAARAIAKGLFEGHDASRPGYWIHVSGTGILCWYDMDNKRYGEPPLPDQEYDDLLGVDLLLNLPDTAFHRYIDKIVLEAAAAKPDVVKVAIVCPPTIYGPGRGPGNQRSRQVPGLVATTLKNGFGPKVGTGKTEWDNVNVHDLSEIFVLLADDAASPNPNPDEKEIWGPQGYYLAENGTHVWGEVAEWTAREAVAMGLIPEVNTKNLTAEEAEELGGFQALSWGLNSKGHAQRARKFLGWVAKGKSLEDSLPELVESEAERLAAEKKA